MRRSNGLNHLYIFTGRRKNIIALIGQLCKDRFPAKYTVKEQKEFLDENSWSMRLDDIENILK